ncbi:MAG: efflux RND transporter periplasmic adaptor subunit [Sphingobacteriaceae bacterium]|nr:efflux RND transporter periplasmic adaptor subunit [Sphingobacteriaceae bacterium]
MRLIVTYLSILLLIVSCGDKTELISPTLEKITESVYASGNIKSKNQYQVFSTVNGIIEEIYVREGELVQPNDSILKIKNFSSRMNAANAKIAANLASINSNGEKVVELKNLSELALAKYKSDSINFIRQQNLWAQQIGSKNELEQKELLFKNSKSNYINSLLRYNDLKKQLEFTEQQALNNLEISNSNESDFIIKSSVKGKLYSLLKEKGELVTTQGPIAVIGDDQNFEIELLVDEYDITKIKLEQKVFVTMDSYKKRIFDAVVTKIDPIMNEKTRTFKILAEFKQLPETIYPNLTVEANILIQEKDKVLTIPRIYLLGDTAVMLESKELKKVTTGLMDYKKVEITSGLQAEDKIRKPD